MPREGMHQCTKYFVHRSRNVRSALNHLQFKDANGGNGAFRKEDKANRYRSTMAIPENRIQLAAKAQDALYTCQKFSKRRMRRMHAQNRLLANDPFYILQETNKNIFFLFPNNCKFTYVQRKKIQTDKLQDWESYFVEVSSDSCSFFSLKK